MAKGKKDCPDGGKMKKKGGMPFGGKKGGKKGS